MDSQLRGKGKRGHAGRVAAPSFSPSGPTYPSATSAGDRNRGPRRRCPEPALAAELERRRLPEINQSASAGAVLRPPTVTLLWRGPSAERSRFLLCPDLVGIPERAFEPWSRTTTRTATSPGLIGSWSRETLHRNSRRVCSAGSLWIQFQFQFQLQLQLLVRWPTAPGHSGMPGQWR